MPARIKGKAKVILSENVPVIKQRTKLASGSKIRRKISSNLNLSLNNNQGQKRSLRSRAGILNNSATNNSSWSSNDSLMNNDGIITKTVYLFTPPKNANNSKNPIDVLSMHEPIIDKLIKENHKKIKQLSDGIRIPTRSTRIHKLKYQPLKKNKDVLKMPDDKLKKFNHIGNFIDINKDLGVLNRELSQDEILTNKFETSSNNTEISSLENSEISIFDNFLQTCIPYDSEWDKNVNLLNGNNTNSTEFESLAHRNDITLTESLQCINDHFRSDERSSLSLGGAKHSSESQDCNKFAVDEDSSFYEKVSKNSMLQMIDEIIKENNLELQLRVQEYVHKVKSIKSLVFLVNSFDKKESAINLNGLTETANYNDLASNNWKEKKDFKTIKNYDLDKKDLILENVAAIKEENDKNEDHFNQVSSLNLTKDSAFENKEENISKILLSNAVEENVEKNEVVYIEPYLTENDENIDLISEESIRNSMLKEDEKEVTKNNLQISETDNYDCDIKPLSIKYAHLTEMDLSINKTNTNNKNDISLVPGNIFWARVNKHPYWPCMVCPDSESQVIKKFGRDNVDSIRVRFFADNGRFAWVKRGNIMPYYGKNEFLEKAKGNKGNNKKKSRNPFYIKNNHKDIWNQACQEADILLVDPIGRRLNKFNTLLDKSIESLRVIKERKLISDSSNRKPSELMDQGKRKGPGAPNLINTEEFMLEKRRKIDPNFKENTMSFKFFCDEIRFLVGNSFVVDDSQINVYINGLWQHRQYNLSKRGSNRAKILADNKVINMLEVEKASVKIEKFDSVAAEVKKDKSKKSKSIPIEETIEDILKLPKTHLFQDLKKEVVCHVCLTASTDQTIKCYTDNCPNWIHIKCTADVNHIESILLDLNEKKIFEDKKIEILCKTCKNRTEFQCFVCKEPNFDQEVQKGNHIKNSLIKCRLNQCGKYFHQKCLRYWPQARLSMSSDKVELICPSHICQTCISDDPRRSYTRCLKLIKCVECPSSYHVDSHCVPAGTVFLTKTDIICPRHEKSKRPVCNTDWCFMCSKLGTLICCETCPSSFHLDCLKLKKIPDDGYICEQCESGRMPLYGEMVWAKHGSYRYWPGIIIPPIYVPLPVQRIRHQKFSFCVRFLGTHDHSWLNSQRVYLYQDDDWRYFPKNAKSNKLYSSAIQESHKISEFLKSKKIELNIQDRIEVPYAPHRYSKILFNRLVAPVKLQEISGVHSTCSCDPRAENPCSLYSECINRVCFTECDPKLCLAGEKCGNQMFEKRQYAPVKLLRTKNKGFGLFSETSIPSGTFIIEYVGELINDAELRRRIDKKIKEKDEVFYFLNLSNNLTIDAGPRGNLSRFMNHSCDPNCEAQTWIVNGYRRIGLFAINDIPANTELTFHYNLESYGESRTHCLCGSKNCTGFIGTIKKKTGKTLGKDEGFR